MFFPDGLEDEDEYDSEEDPDFDYDEEDYYHHHGFDDLYDDVGDDYDYDVWGIQDQWTYVKNHEIVLCEYSPENKDGGEDITVPDVLKVAVMTTKLVDALKLRLGSEEEDSFRLRAVEVSSQLGGEEKVEQLHNNAKVMKKSVMKSLKRSLSELLPLSLEEHILENILGYLNLYDEETNQAWRLEIPEEDYPILTTIYLSLTQIYCKMRAWLFNTGPSDGPLTPEAIDQLQEVVSEFSEREDSRDQVEKGDKVGEEENKVKEEGNKVEEEGNQLERI